MTGVIAMRDRIPPQNFTGNKRNTGTVYEHRAARWLTSRGHEILALSFSCRFGEVDVISRIGNLLVFSEVKYRSTLAYGSPAQAVTRQKQRRISNVASWYLYSRGYGPDTPCRFDVIAVSPDSIQVYENAFGYQGDFDY